jgi:leucyl-tRNA synthetase
MESAKELKNICSLLVPTVVGIGRVGVGPKYHESYIVSDYSIEVTSKEMKRDRTITEITRELRKNQTPSEQVLWEQLRKRRLGGYRFNRQKPLIYETDRGRRYFFIADFYCAEKKLVVEVDGSIHAFKKYEDYQRDLVLRELGLRTIRIRNEELADIERVKSKILQKIKG